MKDGAAMSIELKQAELVAVEKTVQEALEKIKAAKAMIVHSRNQPEFDELLIGCSHLCGLFMTFLHQREAALSDLLEDVATVKLPQRREVQPGDPCFVIFQDGSWGVVVAQDTVMPVDTFWGRRDVIAIRGIQIFHWEDFKSVQPILFEDLPPAVAVQVNSTPNNPT